MKTQLSRFLAIVLFLFIGYSGIIGWWNQWNHCSTIYEEIQTIAQLLFGVLSLPAIILLILKRPLPEPLEGGFTVAFVIAGGMAPVVWGHQGVLIGFAAGGVTVLMAIGILWLARIGSRGLTSGSS